MSQNVAASPFWAANSAPADRKSSGFSPFVAFCFAINYILGTGFLTIPWAFVQGGLILSSIVLLTVCVFADAAKDYLLETMARAEAMLDEGMRWKDAESSITNGVGKGLVYSPVISRANSMSYDDVEAGAAARPKMSGLVQHPGNNMKIYDSFQPIAVSKNVCGNNSAEQKQNNQAINKAGIHGRQLIRQGMSRQEYLVKNRKFEVNTLCRVFLGKQGLRTYTLCISLYIYGALWAYTSVFSSAMSGALPLLPQRNDETNYSIYVFVFGLIVVPMSCLELDEQVEVQVLLTGCRFLMVFLMVVTSWSCAEDSGISSSTSDQSNAIDFKKDTSYESPMFCLSNFHKMLPILVFATIYHHSIPGLAHPVADKKKLSGIFLSTGLFSGAAYCFIGFILGSVFGDKIKQSANLNWKDFRGGTGTRADDGTYVDVALWAKFISSYILCFPALDVISAFPLCAITLGNNILGAFHGNNIHEIEVRQIIFANAKAHTCSL